MSGQWPPDQDQKAAELRTECHSRPTDFPPPPKDPDGGEIASRPPDEAENANALVSDWIEALRAKIRG